MLHNHLESGESAYRYPLVQYKVLDHVPTLVGLNEGADLLIQLFLKIRELQVDGQIYKVFQKNIESKVIEIGLSDDLTAYRFETLWMALNQQNFTDYLNEEDGQRAKRLKSILIGNILSFYKAMNYHVEGNIMVNLKIRQERETLFKNKSMLAFDAEFVTNAILPDCVGLGKSVARGFGSIQII